MLAVDPGVRPSLQSIMEVFSVAEPEDSSKFCKLTVERDLLVRSIRDLTNEKDLLVDNGDHALLLRAQEEIQQLQAQLRLREPRQQASCCSMILSCFKKYFLGRPPLTGTKEVQAPAGVMMGGIQEEEMV